MQYRAYKFTNTYYISIVRSSGKNGSLHYTDIRLFKHPYRDIVKIRVYR